MTKSGIYKIWSKASPSAYIGSAIDLKIRERQHFSKLAAGKHPNIHLQRAWNKYGAASFIFEIIETVESASDLLRREQFWIDHYRETDGLFNICPKAGSSLGREFSQETKTKISVKAKGRLVSAETRERLSVAGKGRTVSEATRLLLAENAKGNKFFLGKTHSEETKKKISEGNKGKVISLEQRRATALRLQGVKLPEETKRKMSAYHAGRKKSSETRARMSEAARIRWQRQKELTP